MVKLLIISVLMKNMEDYNLRILVLLYHCNIYTIFAIFYGTWNYPNGSGRFRTQAGSTQKQTCYFNIENDDKLFKFFLRKCIKRSNLKKTDIHFQIEGVQCRSKNAETFDATAELKSLIKSSTSNIRNGRSQKSTNFSREEFNGNALKKISKMKISFCSMKFIKKKGNEKKKHWQDQNIVIRRLKQETFKQNLSYQRISKNDHLDI